MKCAVHPDVDAVGYCRNCGKAMCSTCVRPVRDVLYCEDCLANVIGIPGAVPAVASNPASSDTFAVPPPPAPPRRGGSPASHFSPACFRVGRCLQRRVQQSWIHIVVFAAIIVGLSSDPGDGARSLLSLLSRALSFSLAFDAMRTARAKTLGESTADPLEKQSKNRPSVRLFLLPLARFF